MGEPSIIGKAIGTLVTQEIASDAILATLSGTILAGEGTLYGFIADSLQGNSTVYLYQSGSLMLQQTLSATNNFVWHSQKGVRYNNLVATLLGTLSLTFFR